MIKKVLLFSVGVFLLSCTENQRVKNFGGQGTINLPKGRKLVNVTWKDTEIWYLTRPMEANDVAQTYQFQESSSWGMLEGTYKIVETK
ncbi:MAG: phage Mater [Bacteroidota bacterium]|jgi:hypothetical protein